MKESKKSISKKQEHSKSQSSVTTGIDYSNIPETDEEFWRTEKVYVPQKKGMITLRLDPDIIEYFKNTGKGYQTKINAVLKSYVNAHSL